MQKLKLSMIAFSLVALGFVSCSKENCVKPVQETVSPSGAKEENLNNAQVGISFSQNPVTEGDAVTITANHDPNAPGVVMVQEFVNGIWIDLANPVVITTMLADNGRQFRGYLDKDNGMNFYSTSITLTVNPLNSLNCAAYALNATRSHLSVAGGVYTISTTYTITAPCDRAVKNIKLQGGLTSKATFVSGTSSDPTTTCVSKITGKGANANTTITWDNIYLPANSSKTFTVKYSKAINCGTTDVVTGAWSAKGKYADDNSPAEVGYNNQQTQQAVDCGL